MTREQEEFHKLLLIEGVETRAFFTSNEFHTIWNAVEKYIDKISQKNELGKPCVSQSVCPNCKKPINHFSMYHNKCFACGNVLRQVLPTPPASNDGDK